MAIAEERLPVGDLTTLSNVVEDDMLLTQTSGANGDVMLTPIAAIISEILTPIFAKLDSPEFTGEPTAPEIADTTTDDARLATTSFVQAVAQRKANLNGPEFTGLAHFADNIPTTVNGEGETVLMATQDDISALTGSINRLAESLNTMSTTVASLSNSPPIFWKTGNATGTLSSDNQWLNTTFAFPSKAGYSRHIIRASASTSGAVVTGYSVENETNYVSFRMHRFSGSDVSVTVTFVAAYLKDSLEW